MIGLVDLMYPFPNKIVDVFELPILTTVAFVVPEFEFAALSTLLFKNKVWNGFAVVPKSQVVAVERIFAEAATNNELVIAFWQKYPM